MGKYDGGVLRRGITMMRWVLPVCLLVVLLIGPLIATPAAAADVNVTLIAKNLGWHVGSDTSTVTTVSVTVGDTLRLRVENQETTPVTHTFTVPQFSINQTLNQGAVFFFNHTAVAGDVGNWQFFCIPHSSGTYPNRSGMIGVLAIANPAAPRPTPGFDAILAIVAVGAVAVIIRFSAKRKK